MIETFCRIYVSSANINFTLEQAKSISDIRRAYCRDHDVTGLLVYGSGNFLRFLEGEKSKVLDVYNTELKEGPH